MNIFNTIQKDLEEILNGLVLEAFLPADLSFKSITVEPPRDPSHGDAATNAAMVLAKPARKNPREIAQAIADKFKDYPYVTSAELAGPGFINLRLNNDIWQQAIMDVLHEGIAYGNSTMGQGEKVNIEYVSANPTGPMHIGHARGAVVGDAIARVMQKAGFDVVKEYYVNDAGSQVDVLARSSFLRYRESLGEDIGDIPEGYYPGDYLKGVGNALKSQYGDALLSKPESEWLPLVRDHAVNAMMLLIRDDLGGLGVVHDVFTSEYKLHEENKLEEGLSVLEGKGLMYRGILEPPKGKKPEDWEPREQTLFRSTDFGDDVDRPLQKSDGSWTYFASDIAYHLDKIHRGFHKMTLILGADHGGYVKRMKAMVAAISDDQAEIDIKLSQLVNFLQNGKPAKMSKRAGTYVTVRDVIDAVGKDIIRFIMLTRRSDMVLDFDLEKVREQSKDNPVFYVQYAHARAKSVLRNAEKEGIKVDGMFESVNLNMLKKLDDPDELQLMKLMAQWPRMLENAATHHEPHRIAFYLQELAGAFHALWNKGKEHVTLRFIIVDDKELTLARLALVKSLALVIASGLNVLGVEPVEEMH